MKNTISNTVVILALIFFNMSCSTVKVSKVQSGSEKGIRYSLGKPFIQVTPSPKGDGSYSVELVYLPDQSQTYAIQTSAFMAKNTMEVNVDESGIIKKIDWSKGGDVLTPASVEALGNIAKAEFERKKKDDDEATAEAKLRKKTAEDLLNSLNDQLVLKSLESNIAQKDKETMESLYTGALLTIEIKEKIRGLDITIKKLELEIETLTIKIAKANTEVEAASKAFNDPTSDAADKAWGPVLFEIKDTYDPFKKKEEQAANGGKVQLVSVDWGEGKKQMEFESIGGSAPTVPATAPEKEPVLTSTGKVTIAFGGNGLAEYKVAFDKEIDDLLRPQSSIKKVSGEEMPFATITCQVDKHKTLEFQFDKNKILPGEYTLLIHFNYKKGEGKEEGVVKVEVILK
jgi:hypothetical protein